MPLVVDQTPDSSLPPAERATSRFAPFGPGAGPGRPVVLVIDDNAAFQRLLTAVFEHDYRTLTASDGKTGCQLAFEASPDLVILDVGLPEMDGHDVLRILRSSPRLATIPVMVVTGRTDEVPNVRLLEEGAQDLIHKPFSLPELLVRVRNLIAAKRTMDMLNQIIGRHETDLFTLASRVARQQQDLRDALRRLELARERAERANRIKGNFLRMMSHEIKTPVTAMQLHMRLIESGTDGDTRDDLHDGIVRMRRSARRLLHLVDTFLEWARADQGRSRLAPVAIRLDELAREVAQELEGYASQKDLTIEVRAPSEPLAAVFSDRTIVRLLLVNLVHRAVQSSRQGAVVVRVSASGDCHVLSVQDTGTPLSPRQQAEALDGLVDGPDLETRAGSGSGLDVQIVRDLARTVQGVLRLDVDPSAGNAWVLSLPSAWSPAQSETTVVDILESSD